MKKKIGAHISVAGGLLNAIDRAKRIGANCMQIFSSPPQQWKASSFSSEDREKFKEVAKNKELTPVFVHGAYLINLASQNVEIKEKSKVSLVKDMNFVFEIGGKGVIFHVGSHPIGWPERQKKELFSFIKEIIDHSPEDTILIIENSAGSGTKIGDRFEELAELKIGINSHRLGFCIDTAHAFASGYDLRNSQDVDLFAQKVAQTIGWKSVVAIHANDSKADFGSNRDCHENIGEGKIGREGFSFLLAREETQNIPFILETPGFSGEGPDKENVQILRGLSTF